MFAPRIAKATTKAPDSPTRKLAQQPSTLGARPLGGGAVDQARMLQGTIGNQATLRYLTQRLSNLPAKGPAERHEQEAAPENMKAREASRGASWDFSKIPLFPPERASRIRGLPPQPSSIQPQLGLGPVNDPLEHEADRTADQVMRMPDIELEDEQEHAMLHRQASSVAPPAGIAPPSVARTLDGTGRPLDPQTRAFFEPRFRRDLSDVRVHTGATAAASAREVGARAYTSRSDIVFSEGRYAPGPSAGKKLLAHELAHVVQQTELKLDGKIQLQPEPTSAANTPAITVPPVYIYSTAYKQQFINKCAEANTIVDLAERGYATWLSAIVVAYATAWQNHDEMLKSLEQSYKLFEEVVIGSLLAAIPGEVGVAVGKTLKSLAAADYVVDGVKDLVKFELRSQIGGAVLQPGSPSKQFKPLPPNPLVWQNLTNQRAQQEMAEATRALLSWQHAMNNEENVDLTFDPVEKIKTALTIDGKVSCSRWNLQISTHSGRNWSQASSLNGSIFIGDRP